MNLAGNLIDAAERAPDRIAIKLDDRELSYAALDRASARVAGLLRDLGVGPGDRVGLMLPNVPQFAVCYYGALRRGAVVVPMNPLFKEREVAHHLSDPGARLLLAWHAAEEAATAGAEAAGATAFLIEPGGFEELLATIDPLADVSDVDPSTTAVILYTSGTTGTPKGAELTHDNLTSNVEVVRQLFRLDAEKVTLGALPLFHSFGQTCGLNATIRAGGRLTLLPRFDAGRALGTIERDRVSVFLGVPTMYAAMLNHQDRGRFDASSLETCVSGGAAMPLEVMRRFEDAFGCVVLEGYGLSETSPVASFNHPDRERKPGSIGTPIADVEMKVVDGAGAELPPGEVGEIVIRGRNLMKGYWGRPDATSEVIVDGWFHTGDLARVDDDGYFFIVDRKKDLIIRGGYNVYPREIEELLHEHPAVREAAVVGIPHPELGEEVGAAVALRDGEDVGPAALREFLRDQLAPYKLPRAIWLVDELPKGPTGKVLKREIARPSREHETAI